MPITIFNVCYLGLFYTLRVLCILLSLVKVSTILTDEVIVSRRGVGGTSPGLAFVPGSARLGPRPGLLGPGLALGQGQAQEIHRKCMKINQQNI